MRRSELVKKILAPPPRLLFREVQFKIALEMVRKDESFKIEGPPGVGKTTLARLTAANSDKKVVFISGYACRNYECIKSRVNYKYLNIIDDYGLILRSNDVVKLIFEIPKKIVIVHPGLYSRELDSLPVVLMPPYSYAELKRILLERVERLSIPVSHRVVDECAREAARHSGSVKFALMLLYERIN